MARFERSRDGRNLNPRRDSRDGDSRGGSRFEGRSGGRPSRDSGRGFSGRGRSDVTMTRVTCSSCKKECEVPFKPTSNKPVFCDDCFAKQDKGSSSCNISKKDIDAINEKLNKIMDAMNLK